MSGYDIGDKGAELLAKYHPNKLKNYTGQLLEVLGWYTVKTSEPHY